MDKQRNGQKNKDKRTRTKEQGQKNKDKRRDNDQQHNTQKTKDPATRTPLKTKGVNSGAREE